MLGAPVAPVRRAPPDLGGPVQAACEGVCGSGGGTCTDAAVVHESGARECSGATVSHSSRRAGQGAMRTPPQHVGAPDAPVHLSPRRSQGRSASPGHRSGPSWRRRRSPASDAERLRPGPNPDKLGAAKMANRLISTGASPLARNGPLVLARNGPPPEASKGSVGARHQNATPPVGPHLPHAHGAAITTRRFPRGCQHLERAGRVKGGAAGARRARTLDASEHSRTIRRRGIDARNGWTIFGEQRWVISG